MYIQFVWADKSKTNKTVENRVDPRLRQDIDDFDNFNNSDDEEIIDADSNSISKPMQNIEELDDEDESRQFLDAYQIMQQEGQKLKREFDD